jgi:hypothetical protein
MSPIPFTKENWADNVRPIKYFSGKITTEKSQKQMSVCAHAQWLTDKGRSLPKSTRHSALRLLSATLYHSFPKPDDKEDSLCKKKKK